MAAEQYTVTFVKNNNPISTQYYVATVPPALS